MKTYVKNGYEKQVRWITVSQQGKLERRLKQQAGQKAQQCEHQWRRWHTALRWLRGASQHALSLHALFHSPWSSHPHSWLKLSLAPFTPSPYHPCEWLSLFDSTYSTLFFPAFLLSVFFFPFFHLSDEQQPDLDKKIMENLCDSANKGSEDTYDFLNLHAGYEPKVHDFDELQNSSVPLSFKIPVADQDVVNLTLGKMLTEAYRGQVDYFVQGGVSVSQSSSSVRSRDQGNLTEKWSMDQETWWA